jgi:hypothetical protein
VSITINLTLYDEVESSGMGFYTTEEKKIILHILE